MSVDIAGGPGGQAATGTQALHTFRRRPSEISRSNRRSISQHIEPLHSSAKIRVQGLLTRKYDGR